VKNGVANLTKRKERSGLFLSLPNPPLHLWLSLRPTGGGREIPFFLRSLRGPRFPLSRKPAPPEPAPDILNPDANPVALGCRAAPGISSKASQPGRRELFRACASGSNSHRVTSLKGGLMRLGTNDSKRKALFPVGVFGEKVGINARSKN